MEPREPERSVLEFLENRELAGITFIRDYIQLLFDGPIINAYTLPRVITAATTFLPRTPGYRDALCEQIGKLVAAAYEEAKEKIAIKFSDGAGFEISLRDEDRVCAEAAMLQAGPGNRWDVW